MNITFLTTASENSLPAILLLIDSLRTYGGELANAPFWVFSENPQALHELAGAHTHLLPLAVSPAVAAYPFGKKVAACAQAEALAPAGTGALAWIDSSCLVVQPPLLFDLGAAFDAAFRPVHIRNVGLPPGEPLDPFWQGICTALELDDIPGTVTAFVDGQCLRSYFNSHAYAVNPRLGLMGRWYERFQQLISDASFQSAACSDEIHQIFLFQGLLSALVASSVEPARLRILPAAYNYPYNLQARLPVGKRAAALNELVCLTYEDRTLHPEAMTDIQVRDPLRAWLQVRAAKGQP